MPSLQVPSSCGKCSASLCHSSRASGIAIFRQLLCFRSPFNPVPDLLTEEARGWTVMAMKRTAGGKLLLLGPAQLSVTYSDTYACFPVLGSNYMPEPCLHVRMRVAHRSGRQCSILGRGEAAECHQQQCVHNWATRAAGTHPPTQHSAAASKNLGVPAVLTQSSPHTEV